MKKTIIILALLLSITGTTSINSAIAYGGNGIPSLIGVVNGGHVDVQPYQYTREIQIKIIALRLEIAKLQLRILQMRRLLNR